MHSQLTYGNWKALVVPTRRQGEPDGLSPREAQHLMALASGQTAKEIARTFGVSVSTVNTSLKRVYGRLRVSRAPAAVGAALRRGWIAPLVLALLVADMSGTAMRVRQPMRPTSRVSASRQIGRRNTGNQYA